MLVGVPKEIKNHEYRVGLTPVGHKIQLSLLRNKAAKTLDVTIE